MASFDDLIDILDNARINTLIKIMHKEKHRCINFILVCHYSDGCVNACLNDCYDADFTIANNQIQKMNHGIAILS